MAGVLLLVAVVAGVARAAGAPVTTPAPAAASAVDTLLAREAILSSQADMARLTARWRARELYRFLRAGAGLPLSDGDRARTLAAGARALARERHEEQLLLAERDQTRAERRALPDGDGAGPAGAAAGPALVGPVPRFQAPLAGRRRARFGAQRDAATGAWFFRAGVRIDARAGQPVRALAAGVVRRVVAQSAQGPALVIDHGGGWISVLANLRLASGPAGRAAPSDPGTRAAAPALAPGMRVAAGQVVGRVAGVPGGLVCELWRGHTPVDPAAFLRF